MNAYNDHSPPPDIDVDPDVVVTVATMFLRGGNTVDRALDGSRARKADVGIREYLSYYGMSHDYPGKTRAPTWIISSAPSPISTTRGPGTGGRRRRGRGSPTGSAIT